MALKSVAVLLQEPVALFEFGVLAEVFGIDRTDEGMRAFDYRVCAETPGPLDARNGTTVTAAVRPRGRRRCRPRRRARVVVGPHTVAGGRAGAARRGRPGCLGDVGVLGGLHPGGGRHPRRA